MGNWGRYQLIDYLCDMNINYQNTYRKSGIYLIRNTVNGKCYIGSAKNLYDRLHQHKCLLKQNRSHNKHLQYSWNKYGDVFKVEILEYCDDEIKFEREQYYINNLQPEYNKQYSVIGPKTVTITEKQKEKISNTLKERYSNGDIKPYRQTHKNCNYTVTNIETGEVIFDKRTSFREVLDFMGYKGKPGFSQALGFFKHRGYKLERMPSR